MKRMNRRLAGSMAIAGGTLVVLAVPGLAAEPGPTATANGKQASGAGLKLGPIGVSESRVGNGKKPEWALVRAGNTTVIGRDANGWSGIAADAGDTVDTVSDALCPDVISVDGSTRGYVCLDLLTSEVSGNAANGFAFGAVASGTIFVENADAVYGTQFLLLPSSASHATAGCTEYSDSSAALAVLFTPQPNGNLELTQVLPERDHGTTNCR